jgi:outer membrane protein OmpA-like peptidoglycan-associated protein
MRRLDVDALDGLLDSDPTGAHAVTLALPEVAQSPEPDGIVGRMVVAAAAGFVLAGALAGGGAWWSAGRSARVAAVVPEVRAEVAASVAAGPSALAAPTAVEPAPVAARGAAASAPATWVVRFGFGAAGPEAGWEAAVAEAARCVGRIDVVGYTCDAGDPAFNQDLSERRARAVAATLTAAGVPEDRLRARGGGPLGAADSPRRADRRRVELRCVPTT